MRADLGNGIRRKHRIAGIVLGIWLVFWLPIEDTNTNVLMGLSAGVAGWLGVNWVLRLKTEIQKWQFIGIGALAGLGTPLVAIVFIAIKAGLHAHGYTDYAPTQIRDVLYSAPWWGMVGAVVGYVGFTKIQE